MRAEVHGLRITDKALGLSVGGIFVSFVTAVLSPLTCLESTQLPAY